MPVPFTQTEITIILLGLIWQLLVPIIYSLGLKKLAGLSNILVYIIGSIALSFLVVIFAYTLLAQSGLINLLARASAMLANGLILALVIAAPIIIAYGHSYLENYQGQDKDSSN